MQKSVKAISYIRGGAINGTVEFVQRSNGVVVTANISGLPKSGFFAFHIHEGGRCLGENFAETGGHYNPKNEMHPNHAGDLPPLLSNNGSAYMVVLTNRFNVTDIVGKTVVIHSGTDDFRTQPAGDAGTKIACGEIRRV